MHYVFVKHYLNQEGVEFFNKKWFPEVQEAIKIQPGYISIAAKHDSQDPGLIHITLHFTNQTTLLAWAATAHHDELVDALDPYRVQAWEFAAIDVNEGECIDRSSILLKWQSVVPKTTAYLVNTRQDTADFPMKERLRFIKNLPTTAVHIRNHLYPVHIAGTGKIPLLSIGIGSHLQMTLPAELLKVFTIYSTDLYWIDSQKITHPEQLTMTDIVDDIFAVISQLKLSNYIIAGFSCFGILALEAAKRLDAKMKAAILISTPPGWNDEIIAAGQTYFNQNASAARKQNDMERKADFLKIKKPNESLGSINAYAADAARYWKDFNVSRDFFDLLWEDIQVNDDIIHHFFATILPAHDLSRDFERLSLPIALFSGQLDYDSIPLILWKTFPKPPHFTVIDCENTGHWPQLEEPDLFTTHMMQWIKNEVLPQE